MTDQTDYVNFSLHEARTAIAKLVDLYFDNVPVDELDREQIVETLHEGLSDEFDRLYRIDFAAGIRDAARQAAGQPDAVEETHIVADDSDDPEHVDDCPGCETAVDHDEHCPTPETHNWGCGCPTDKWPAADARSSIAAHMGTQGNDPTLALLLNRYHEAVARQAVAEHTAAAGQPDTQQPAEAHEPARIRIINHPGVLATADTEIAALLDAYRAEVLREAAQAFTAEADELDRAAQEALDPDMARDAKHLRGFAARLRRMADEAAQ